MAVPLGDGVAWQPGAQSNGFMLVLGASGSGKTEALKTIGTSIHRYGVPLLILDFHGDVIVKDVPSTLLSAGAARTVGINPLEIDLVAAQETGLYDQRTALREMFGRAVPSLGYRQASMLHEALEGAYSRAGITDRDPASWQSTPPTFTDLLTVLTKMSGDGQRNADGVIAGVRDLFGHPVFNRAQHLSVEDMLAASMRLNLSKLPDSVRFIMAQTLLKRVFGALQMRGPILVQPASDRDRGELRDAPQQQLRRDALPAPAARAPQQAARSLPAPREAPLPLPAQQSRLPVPSQRSSSAQQVAPPQGRPMQIADQRPKDRGWASIPFPDRAKR